MKEQDSRMQFNLEFNRRGAIRTIQRLQVQHPEWTFKLYTIAHQHFIVADCDSSAVEDLSKKVDDIRPVACAVRFLHEIPAGAVLVEEEISLRRELWGAYEPLRLLDARRILCVASPGLPDGQLTIDNSRQIWQFSSLQQLSSVEKEVVTNGLRTLDLPGEIEFLVSPKTDSEANKKDPTSSLHPSIKQAELFNLISSGELRSHPTRALVQNDEEAWHNFLKGRESRQISSRAGEAPRELACMWDGVDASEVRLAELLTLYDRVDCLMPFMGQPNHDLLKRLELKEDEFQQLVAMGKIRLILPRPIDQYDDRLIQIASEAKANSVILSRALAAAVLEQGQRKDPLLYGPFSASERIELIRSLLAVSPTNHPLRSVCLSYLEAIENQNLVLMERGAMACVTHGVGAHLSNILKARPNFNAQIELMTIGAQVEWSVGLGATYIPPMIGQYAADGVAAFVASYYGRSYRGSSDPQDPIANRMHTVVSSLLVPADVPAIDIVRNLNTTTLSRFRGVARNLMRHTANLEELRDAVDHVNQDIQVYETRRERLRKWGIGSLIGTAVSEGLGNQLGNAVGYAGSVFGIWLAEMILERVREQGGPIVENIAGVADTFKGLLLAPSLDAVIVQRARGRLIEK